jgi:threonine efflux protein
MIDSIQLGTHANLLLAYFAYVVGAASPGPSNLAVMATAMHEGRKSALIFALGVVSGSVFWGLLAAFGLAAVLATYARALIVLKIAGGLYLLWLAGKSARAAWSSTPTSIRSRNGERSSNVGTYLSGAAMHLTNPKAIFLWLSIVSLALPAGAQARDAMLVVLGCAVLALFVFCSYAIAFSTVRARKFYQSLRRWFEGTLAVLFAYAGIRMLISAR